MHRIVVLFLLVASVLPMHASGSPQSRNSMEMTSQTSAPADFDFLVGQWHVHHRKLKHRLVGSQYWIEFDGTTVLKTLLGGLGNMDENVLRDPSGSYRALTFRLFSPETRQWSIWWVDGRRLALDPPVHGGFEGDVGLFYGDDVFGGHPIKVRFVWTKVDADQARWEQAFSADDGKTWETNWTMAFSRVHDTRQWCDGSSAADCRVIELRQYTLHAGKRDDLIHLFEQQFVETQEAAGMAVLGQFRDLDSPDQFVWLRGFSDMPARLSGLTTFYSGPTWRTYRDRANVTMIDSDNVLLLRPAWPGSALKHAIGDRPALDSGVLPEGFVDITVFPLKTQATQDLLAFCRERMQVMLEKHGAQSVAWYVSEEAANNFPRLPVRTNESVLVGIAVFPSEAEFRKLSDSGEWKTQIAPRLGSWLDGTPQSLRLTPTARSALHSWSDVAR